MQPKKLAFIDTLRGLASLYVVAFHLTAITAPPVVPPLWLIPLINGGGSGVMLFFIVSAFTLCLSMESRATGAAEPVSNFYLRRLFRIAPLFYAWMLVYYIRDVIHFHVAHSAGMVAASLFFVLNLIPGQEQGYVWASWTIGVEMLFYVLFPLIFARTRNIGIALALLLLALVLRLPWHGILTRAIADPGEAELFYEYSLIFNLGVFLAGVLLYRIYKLIDMQAATRHGAGYALIAGFAAGHLWQSYCGPFSNRTDDVAFQTLDYSMLLLGLAISPIPLIVNRVTQFYGKISYSVYLSHATIVYFMAPLFARVYRHAPTKTLAFALSMALALAVITPVSYLTYRFIETPGNALGRALIRRRAAASPGI